MFSTVYRKHHTHLFRACQHWTSSMLHHNNIKSFKNLNSLQVGLALGGLGLFVIFKTAQGKESSSCAAGSITMAPSTSEKIALRVAERDSWSTYSPHKIRSAFKMLWDKKSELVFEHGIPTQEWLNENFPVQKIYRWHIHDLATCLHAYSLYLTNYSMHSFANFDSWCQSMP